ncbi:MAG: carbohydrate ABC transporter permease [Eubacteriales bacterium]|nr:carbohydrate ABC transporter permease [Eubacteriales bacterium]
MKKQKKIRAVIYHVFCSALAFIMIWPVLWLCFSAFKGKEDIFQNAGSLLPKEWIFENFVNGWKGFGGVGFGTFFRNSFIVTVGATALSTFFSALVAYGFARIPFKGRGFFFACMMMTLMLPTQVLMVPQYMLFSKLGWINTYLPLIVPYFGGYAFFIFLCVQFIKGIPIELDESACIDGCGRLGTFFQIILPLSKSALVTSAIFSFYWRWSDFIGPMLYLKKPKLYTVSVALKLFADPNSVTDWGAMFAMSFLSLLPVILIFLLLQKYIVEGISTTGLKG